MARFLIIEPHEDIRRLYAAVVHGLGHEPIFLGIQSVDEPHVILVEPADPESLAAARGLRQRHPRVPIVCASIYERALHDVDVLQAITYLLKPFKVSELTGALQMALLQSQGSS